MMNSDATTVVAGALRTLSHLQVVPCLLSTTRKILGPSTILQAAVPDILDKVPQTYFENTMNVVQVCIVNMYSCMFIRMCVCVRLSVCVHACSIY